jgi:two-component system, cell cycle sensor histidine kinase and response regulator CckA
MKDRTSTGWLLPLSVLCYLVGAGLLTRFVEPNGLGLMLLALPLFSFTRQYGRKAGLLAAAAGVLLNSIIWTTVGNGIFALRHASVTFILVRYVTECAGAALLVLLVDTLRKAEQARQEEMERSRTLFEIAPAAMFVVEKGRLSYFNNHAVEMLGYSPEELRGLPISSILHPEDFEHALALFAARSEGRLLPVSTTRIRRKDGTVIWVETVGERIEWDGRPAVLYFSSDVSERMAAEERYRISESKYRSLVELAPEAISVVEDGRVSFCNTHFLEMLGYAREEMIGLSIDAITHMDDLASARERYQHRVEGTVLPKAVFRHVRKDGGVIWVETVGQRIEWEGRPAVLYFSSDITERRALEEQFVQAQKMESVGRLAGGIAHDFNNILQVILGFCEILLTTDTDPQDVVRVVKTIKESAERAAALTMQLLAFSRKQSVVFSAVDLAALVRDSRDMLAQMLGEDILVTHELEGDGAVVNADAGQLQQVLMNLAVNARDAMPEGGKLTISIQRSVIGAGDTGRPVEMSPGDYVLLQVSDTGVGMNAETLSRLFEPFFTTKELGKGTGLGLSIVYGIVKQTKGHVFVESRLGGGTTFKIYLPRVPGAPETARTREGSERRGTETVLLVEDEDGVRNLVQRQLAASGYQVLTASDGTEALEVCRKNPGGIDVLLTDVVLPGARGGKVAEAFRVSNPGGRVIYMTGYTDASGFEDRARREGATILQKPFTLSSLVSGIRQVLSGSSR